MKFDIRAKGSKYSHEVVKELVKKANWSDEDLVDCLVDNINWYDFSWNIQCDNNPLSDEFLEAFEDKLDIYVVLINHIVSEKFLRKHCDKLDKSGWDIVSYLQNLSEDFIRDYSDKVDWYSIFENQKLSEPFIEEFIVGKNNPLLWCNISKYQRLSDEFILHHIDKLWLNLILEYQGDMSDETRATVKEKYTEHIKNDLDIALSNN